MSIAWVRKAKNVWIQFEEGGYREEYKLCGLLFDASYAVFSFCCIVGGVIGYSIESSVSDK